MSRIVSTTTPGDTEADTSPITTSTVAQSQPLMIGLDPDLKHMLGPIDGVEALINLDSGDS